VLPLWSSGSVFPTFSCCEPFFVCYNSLLDPKTSISHVHSCIPLACAECYDSLPFSGVSSILLCYIPLPSTSFHQQVFHPPTLHLAICFLVYLSALLFPNSYIIFFGNSIFFHSLYMPKPT